MNHRPPPSPTIRPATPAWATFAQALADLPGPRTLRPLRRVNGRRPPDPTNTQEDRMTRRNDVPAWPTHRARARARRRRRRTRTARAATAAEDQTPTRPPRHPTQ